MSNVNNPVFIAFCITWWVVSASIHVTIALHEYANDYQTPRSEMRKVLLRVWLFPVCVTIVLLRPFWTALFGKDSTDC